MEFSSHLNYDGKFVREMGPLTHFEFLYLYSLVFAEIPNVSGSCMELYQWFSARPQYLLSISNGETAVLH